MYLLHVLWILKIIGIILLCLIGFLFVMLVFALLVPVRYKVCLDKKEDIYACFRVSWLANAVRLMAVYNESDVTFKYSIFGLPLDKIISTIKKIKINKKEKKKKKKTSKNDSKKEEVCKIEKNKKEEIKDKAQKTKKNKTKKKEKKSWSDKKDYFFEKIENTKKSIADIFEKISNIRDFIEKESNKMGISAIKKYIILLLKHIRPRKIKGRIRFGFKEPDTTGKVLAFISVIYAWYGSNIDYNVQKNIKIIPEFEEKVFETKFFIKGKIHGIVILNIAIKVLRDKSLKRLKNNFSKSFQ